MAADFITVNRGKPLGNQLVEAAGLLLRVRTLIESMTATGQHGFTGADYKVFEDLFGLAVNTGANTLALLTLVNEDLNTAVERTGAARLAQLDEFIARLAGQ